MPRVSVIIPTYNRREYVQEAIDSVLAQTYRGCEFILMDDSLTVMAGRQRIVNALLNFNGG